MGFSRDARMRMLRLINKIYWQDVGKCTFITLTYPDSHLMLGNVSRKRHRDQFFQDIERQCGYKVPFLWKVEWQLRKSGAQKGVPAPHMHIMALGVGFLDHNDVRSIWRKIIIVKGPLATDVRGIKGIDGAARYMAKYVSKSSSLDIAAYRSNPLMKGRTWGLTRPNLVPMWAPNLFDHLDVEEIERLRKYASDKFRSYDPELGGGFTVFGVEGARGVLGALGRGD